MVNNEMSEEVIGDQADLTESTNSPTSSKLTVDEQPNEVVKEAAGDDDESLRLSPTSLYCSVPINRDVQTIIDAFGKTDSNDKVVKKTRKLPCLYCERTFVADNLRQKHIERCHSIKQARRSSLRFQQSGTAVTCLFCNKFSLPDNVDNALSDLFQHLLAEHSTRYFGCLPCKERFTLLTQLEEHNEDVHGIKREPKVQINEDPVEEGEEEEDEESVDGDSAINEKSTIEEEEEEEDEDEDEAKTRPQSSSSSSTSSSQRKRIGIKSTKLGVKKSVRLQNKVIPTSKASKKRQKAKLEEQPKSENDKEVKVAPHENPYPQFDAFYRVKKITDHSIDNIRIASLTFTDVFDQAFFTRIKCNIRENLLNHIDGKLFKNEESESRISNFEKTEITPPTSENYGCELSLNAIAPMSNLLSTHVGDDLEAQIEYGSKASKKKITPKQDEVHYKYFTRRKYQASILESKENRDLSKLDMWTQYVIKTRQQKMLDNSKSDKERQDYKKGDEYKAKVQNDELNRILDRRGPFEDLIDEANKKAALEGIFNQEANAEVTSILDDILNNVFAKKSEDVEVKTELTDTEIPSYLNLSKAPLSDEHYVDKSDKISLICSSQETENFEVPQISPKDKNALAELTGEWTRKRLYICAACGLKVANMKLLIDHKNFVHQNVWCQHYEFVGNQGEFYKHLSIPGLGKMGFVDENPTCKAWKRSEARVCTKCKKQCNTLGELHRHILECGEDWSWMLVRKKCKYKPFGAKTRKKRRGLIKRIINKEKRPDENREKKIYKKEGPRSKPSDAETIQRMLANLPAKRATRKLICLKDGISRPRKNPPKQQQQQQQQQHQQQQQQNKNAEMRSTTHNSSKTVIRRSRAEILLQESNKILKRKVLTSGLKCNPVGNIRKSIRNINKVVSSAIIDNNGGVLMKRKLKNALQQRIVTRRTNQLVNEDVANKNEELVKDEAKNRFSIIKKVKHFKKPKQDEGKLSAANEDAKVEIVSASSSRSSTPLIVPNNQVESKVEGKKVDETNSPAKKRLCKKSSLGTKFIRKLSMRKKNKVDVEKQVEKTTENVNENKSTAKRKFGALRSVVKKMKLNKKSNNQDAATKLQHQQHEEQKNKTDNLVNIIGGHFLEVNLSEKSAESVNAMKNSELVHNSETSSTIKDDECDLNNETISKTLIIDVSGGDLTKSDESVEKKGKTKICKRAKGLNACIAMLTSKLTQKDDEPCVNSGCETILKIPTLAKISHAIMEQNAASHEWISRDLPLNEKDDTCEEAAVAEAINQPFEIKEDIIEESKTVSSTMASPLLEQHEGKENVVELEEKSIESLIGIANMSQQQMNEKVADVIKRYEDLQTNENFTDILTNHIEFNNKTIRKIGAQRKRAIRSKTMPESEIATSIDDRLNVAILADEDPLFGYATESSDRKIGQKRILSKRKLKSPTPAEEANDEIPEIPETLIKKDLSAIMEENCILLNDIECQSIAMKNMNDIIKSDLFTPKTNETESNYLIKQQPEQQQQQQQQIITLTNDNLNSSKANTLIEKEFDKSIVFNSNETNELNSYKSNDNDIVNKQMHKESNLSDYKSILMLENEPDVLENKLVIENSLNRTIVSENNESDSEDELPLAVLAKSKLTNKIINSNIIDNNLPAEKRPSLDAPLIEKEEFEVNALIVKDVVDKCVNKSDNIEMEIKENTQQVIEIVQIPNIIVESGLVDGDDEKSKLIESIYELNEGQEQEVKDIITSEIVSDNSKENMNDHESPKRPKRKSIKYATIDLEEPNESEYLTPLKENKNTDIQNESFIQTPDLLNDSLLNNKLATKLKMRKGKKQKAILKKKDADVENVDNYCDICKKRFVRNDSLMKHKRTLTHIAKLSEIEAREAAAKAIQPEPEVEIENVIIEKATDQCDDDRIVDELSNHSRKSLNTNTDAIQLANIISDVFKESPNHHENDNFANKPEPKRYKSLGERKSFDSDSIIYNAMPPTFPHINKMNDMPDEFLEKQISILENIIEENKSNFQYIDEISNKSEDDDERCPSDMSLVSDIKQDDSNIISINHNPAMVSSLMHHPDVNFIKPSQYEEISEDSLNTRNFDDQRLRKVLNRDEELFLECCSLLKSSSEMSNYSKKSTRTISMVNNLKMDEEPEWMERKSLTPQHFSTTNGDAERDDDDDCDDVERDDEYLSDSCPNTPNTFNDFSNSNTIESNWDTTNKEDVSLDSIANDNANQKAFNLHKNSSDNKLSDLDDDNMDSITFRKNINARFGNLMAEALKSNTNDSKKSNKNRKKQKHFIDVTQTSIKDYAIPLSKDSLDSLLNDSKKSLITKGAKKVFEGLKVSIPTEELNMKEVLNCSPKSKRLEIEGCDLIKEEKCDKKERSKGNLNKFGNKLGLKVTKRKNRIKTICDSNNDGILKQNKAHDIYDFEETQDNTDVFNSNNLLSFRTQGIDKMHDSYDDGKTASFHGEEENNYESDSESNHDYMEPFSFETQSLSSFSTESSNSIKKNLDSSETITKKKNVIMGRIFKNAFKPKCDDINKEVPASVVGEEKGVEDVVVANCTKPTDSLSKQENRLKMSEQEMNLLFDKLLEDNLQSTNKAKIESNSETKPQQQQQQQPQQQKEKQIDLIKSKVRGGKHKKRVRKVSESSDDEFNMSKTPKKRTVRSKKVKDNEINLEQEFKECMGVAGRKSQRKCTSGKQNVLVEVWSSDDSEFEAMLKRSLAESSEPPKQQSIVEEEEVVIEKEAEIVREEVREPTVEKETISEVKPRKKSSLKTKLPRVSTKPSDTLAANRRKRSAADTLYYWSSSSEDESQNLIEVKSIRDENDDEEEDNRPMQHGWIVGDSPKKLVTMLAQAKGKKVEAKPVKEQTKKRTTI